MKIRTFTATDAEGNRYKWAFWREGGYWMLRDPEGYVRTLEKTWIDSVPRIRGTLDGYGMTAEIS